MSSSWLYGTVWAVVGLRWPDKHSYMINFISVNKIEKKETKPCRWPAPAFVGICWPAFASLGCRWHVLTFGHLPWVSLACTGICWPAFAVVGLRWPLLGVIGLRWPDEHY